MKPEILCTTEARELRQGIDGARAGGARGADHHERRAPVSPVGGDETGEILDIHLKLAVRGDHSDSVPSEPRHVGDLAE